MLELADIFDDHMVLQREMSAPIWGRGTPGRVITVTFAEQQKQNRVNEDGQWRIDLDAMGAGGPSVLTVESDARDDRPQRCVDVLVGDVWLCAGQSNMAMPLGHAEGADVALRDAERPHLRLNRAGWVRSTRESAETFAAVAWWFGQHLQDRMRVPIGIIQRAQGGTGIHAFMHPDAIRGCDRLKEAVLKPWLDYLQAPSAWQSWIARLPTHRHPESLPDPEGNKTPGDVFASHIEPLIPYAIRGIAWYQGESDAWSFAKASLYHEALQAMIADWRKRWQRPMLPWLIVQLPNGPTRASDQLVPEITPWQLVQEAQAEVAKHDRHADVIVTVDTAEASIHPTRKRHVGQRLADAVNQRNNDTRRLASGPCYERMQIEGDRVRLHFTDAERGFTPENGALAGFAVAGADRAFFAAEAHIDGRTVVLHSPSVPAPVAARYCFWAGAPWSLKDVTGRLVSPFRTDDWSWDLPSNSRAAAIAARTAHSPTIDGNLDEPMWKTATPITHFTHAHTYRPAGTATEARLLWDDQHLYVGFRCAHAASKHESDDTAHSNERAFWRHDHVEMLIAAGNAPTRYHRIALNSQGERYDAIAINDARLNVHRLPELVMMPLHRGLDESWSSHADHAVIGSTDAWTAELAIPWRSLGVMCGGAVSAVGLQLRRGRPMDGPAFFEWSPEGRDWNTGAMPQPALNNGFQRFHSPQRFGTLRLAGSPSRP